MTNHPELQISAYIDNELSEQDRQEVENHIESCTSCQRLLEEMLVMQTDVSQMYSRLQAPKGMDDRILQAIRDESAMKVNGLGWFSIPVVALLVLGILWLMTGAVLLKLLSGLMKFTVVMVYMVSHFISTLPILAGLTLVLSLIILSISSYSLKRLLQTTTG
ncbi:MAG: zf-HC2 domain-containing protein [Paenibacillaceae bacterium]